MANTKISGNFNLIFNTFLKYLPSRLLVILNSLIIIPFFAYILTEKEMGIYQLIICSINLLCTCSTDWITKSSLRFYEKYKLQNKLPKFYSNILIISAITYLLILVLYFLFSDYISAKFFIPKDLLALTLVLLIPCGLRQFLYQMLRVFNKPYLYTFSIIVYQFAHLLLFLVLSHVFSNIFAILLSMTIGMLIIDIYIIRKIQLKSELHFSIEKDLIKETLTYSLPTILTNSGIWLILHIDQFLFQKLTLFNYTAIAGIGTTYTSYLITPIVSTFLFAIFPLIIQRYENKRAIKNLTTRTIQLYCAMFIPYVSAFVLYSREITNTMFGGKYEQVAIIMPFFALTIFIHELKKILNIKYHLKNRTYIEMFITIFTAVICIILNFKLIPTFHLWGAGIALLSSVTLLITLHSFVNFKGLTLTHPTKIIRTCSLTILTSATVFLILHFGLQNILPAQIVIIKPILYLILTYTILWNIKNRVLI